MYIVDISQDYGVDLRKQKKWIAGFEKEKLGYPRKCGSNPRVTKHKIQILQTNIFFNSPFCSVLPGAHFIIESDLRT